MKKLIIAFFFISTLIAFSCNNKQKVEDPANEQPPIEEVDTSEPPVEEVDTTIINKNQDDSLNL